MDTLSDFSKVLLGIDECPIDTIEQDLEILSTHIQELENTCTDPIAMSDDEFNDFLDNLNQCKEFLKKLARVKDILS